MNRLSWFLPCLFCGLAIASWNVNGHADDGHADDGHVDDRPSILLHTPIDQSIHSQFLYVIAGQDGAGALLLDPIEERANKTGNGIVLLPYRWRYLQRGATSESTGRGKLFAKMSDGLVKTSNSEISVGPYRLQWSYKSDKKSDLIFDAEKLALHPAVPRLFEDKGEQKALDLSSFLNPDPAIQEQYREAEKDYAGPDSDPISFTGQVSAPVSYDGGVLVLDHPEGIATFKFKESFERNIDDLVTHHGVSYDYQFSSGQESAVAGEDEVYELYVDNQYKNGRLNLQAKSIALQWSRGGRSAGWIYYHPQWARAWIVSASDVNTLLDLLRERKRLDQ